MLDERSAVAPLASPASSITPVLPLRLLLGALLVFAVAAIVGLGATSFVSSRDLPFGRVQIGAWSAWPKTGTQEIDPYGRALTARSGVLPLASGDGIAFLARADDAGRALDARCEVVLSGTTPPARYWTLAAYDHGGALIPNAVGRYGFTSGEILRHADGRFEIVAAPRAQPGNWLPVSGKGRYTLVMRLYDTPIGVRTRADRQIAMPAIGVKSCG